MKSAEQIFPELWERTFIEVDLDREARARQQARQPLTSTKKSNPFLDPKICSEFVAEVAAKNKGDFTYGGYLEDRRFLWATSYLDTTKNYLHLGVDFNVPPKTEVAALFSGEVIRIDDDKDSDGGWGPRIIVRPADSIRPYVIFAHLGKLFVSNGEKVEAGKKLAEVGGPPHNGNWFPHLHVQTVQRNHFESLLAGNLQSLDGYGDEGITDLLRNQFPNPLSFAWIVGQQFRAKC